MKKLLIKFLILPFLSQLKREQYEYKFKINHHKVPVYDQYGVYLNDTWEYKTVVKIVRWEHDILGQKAYSDITYYDNGLMHYGLIPSPPFKGTYLIQDPEETESC